MAEAGLFRPDDRLELVEGEIIDMAPIGSRHAACVNRLSQLLIPRLGERAILRVHGPVRLSDLSEPQPDIAVLAPRDDFYAGGHPGPADVLLVVEVAETVGWDRDVKMPLYGRAAWPRRGWWTWRPGRWRSSAPRAGRLRRGPQGLRW